VSVVDVDGGGYPAGLFGAFAAETLREGDGR